MGGNTSRRGPLRLVTSGAAVVIGCAGLVACSTDDRHSFFAFSDSVISDAGDSVATNKAAHTVDPWSPASRNNRIPMDGKRADAAVRRYRTDTVKKPKGLTGSSSSDSRKGGPTIR